MIVRKELPERSMLDRIRSADPNLSVSRIPLNVTLRTTSLSDVCWDVNTDFRNIIRFVASQV